MGKLKDQLAGIAALIAAVVAIGGGFAKYGELNERINTLTEASKTVDYSILAVMEEKIAALEAGNLILSFYKADYEIRDKGYHNPVTTADHASDNRIKEILVQSFPEYGWLSEETVDSKNRLRNERVWVVDPLDGTKEFIEGVPHFVVSIALVRWHHLHPLSQQDEQNLCLNIVLHLLVFSTFLSLFDFLVDHNSIPNG